MKFVCAFHGYLKCTLFIYTIGEKMKIESLNVVLAGQRKKVKRNVPLLFIYFFSMLLNIKNVMKLMKNYDQLLFRDS